MEASRVLTNPRRFFVRGLLLEGWNIKKRAAADPPAFLTAKYFLPCLTVKIGPIGRIGLDVLDDQCCGV
jgi:hypothetical protein